MRNGTSRDREQEPGGEDEWELSVLLERTVPQPLAPTDRMAQVRRRVQRRRRRRMAALSTAAVAAVGVGVLTVTGLTGSGAGPHRQTVATPAAAGTATSTSAATLPPTSSSMPSAGTGTGEDAYTTVRLTDLYGLTLRLPRGWKGFTTLDKDAMMIGFVSQQPMQQQSSCKTTLDLGYSACPPVGKLGKGAALIYVHKLMYTKEDGKTGFDVLEPSAPSKGCQVLDGDAEMQAWGGIPTKKDRPLMLNVSVCLREPSQDTITAVRVAFETARFPQG
ncbi:hypothetical protein ACFYXS_18350 [Streptomyces sp. NPDC002574]|uniref:hypothetical protein n=1 Tax=Streptomyces sp. NPDC002574 TaxID=3364652 RepID=UPI0036A43EF4